ncbi:hypothetical protein KR059_001133, partial [Drosophila kikkawai]
MVTRANDARMEEVSDSVSRVRKTAKGELLLEIKRNSQAQTCGIRDLIGKALGAGATIRTMTPQRDPARKKKDELTTKEELEDALVKQANLPPNSVTVKGLRAFATGSQTATFTVPAGFAGALSNLGKVKVGWTRCRIKELEPQLNSGKAAQWVCGNTSLRLENVLADKGFVRAKVGGWWVYSIYLAPSLTLAEFAVILDRLAADARGRSPTLLAGDFNAWAVDWGSPTTNVRGRTLLEVLSTLDVALLNVGQEHTFSWAGAGSVVDLTFASRSRAGQCTWMLSGVYT